MDNMLEHPWSELQALIKEKWLTQKAFASILWKKVSEVNELLKWKRNITIQRDYLLHQTLWTPIKYWILKQVDYDYSLLDIEESPDSPLDKEGLGEIWRHPEQSEKSTSHQTNHSEHSEESISDDLSSWANACPAGLDKDLRWDVNKSNTQDSSLQTPQNDNITQTNSSEHSEESISDDLSSWATAKDLRWEIIKQNTQNSSESKDNKNLNISPLDKGDTFTMLAWAKPRGFEQPQETTIQEQKIGDEEDHKKRANIFKSF